MIGEDTATHVWITGAIHWMIRVRVLGLSYIIAEGILVNNFDREFESASDRYVEHAEDLNELKLQVAMAFKTRRLLEKAIQSATEMDFDRLSDELAKSKIAETQLREAVGEAEYIANELFLAMTIAGCKRNRDPKTRLIKEMKSAIERADKCGIQATNARDELAHRIALRQKAQHERAAEIIDKLCRDCV